MNEERFREFAPDTWHGLIGLRNAISHGYIEIDLSRIWISIKDLPTFRESLDLADGWTNAPD